MYRVAVLHTGYSVDQCYQSPKLSDPDWTVKASLLFTYPQDHILGESPQKCPFEVRTRSKEYHQAKLLIERPGLPWINAYFAQEARTPEKNVRFV
jgi:hypothetical protein